MTNDRNPNLVVDPNAGVDLVENYATSPGLAFEFICTANGMLRRAAESEQNFASYPEGTEGRDILERNLQEIINNTLQIQERMAKSKGMKK
jgi:hypothetical protein